MFDEQDILFLRQVFGAKIGLIISRALHRHFYEGGLDRETFNILWTKALKLLDEAKQVVYKLYTKAV
jgi:hypothetical protein